MCACDISCVDQIICQATYYKWMDWLIWMIIFLDMHREIIYIHIKEILGENEIPATRKQSIEK